jgi:protein gp37
MASNSEIEWTEATWNPIAGCSVISPGCTNCYAMRMAARLEAMGVDKYRATTRRSGKRAVWTGRVNVDSRSVEAPLHWRTPRRIFVNSMSDLFQDAVEEDVIASLWAVMAEASWHSFQILTKRPERMRSILSSARFAILPNVWLGTSVENQAFLDRVEQLRQTPAHIRFVSFEPLIGSIVDPDLTDIHWAIVGGESGPGCLLLQAMGRDAKEEHRARTRWQDVGPVSRIAPVT